MWTDTLENPKAIGMFDPEPSLERVVLSKLLLDYDGPTATMSLLLRDYPAKPPNKWRTLEHNAVVIELQAMALDGIELRAWSTGNEVSMSIERLPDGKLKIQAFGAATNLELRCGWLRLAGVTPFRRTA